MDKGSALMREAEKKLKGGWLSNLVGGNNKFEDAADLYIKAGNAFKMSKDWENAAEAYKKAAGCFTHAQSAHEAATAYINAANALKKHNPPGSLLHFPRLFHSFLHSFVLALMVGFIIINTAIVFNTQSPLSCCGKQLMCTRTAGGSPWPPRSRKTLPKCLKLRWYVTVHLPAQA